MWYVKPKIVAYYTNIGVYHNKLVVYYIKNGISRGILEPVQRVP